MIKKILLIVLLFMSNSIGWVVDLKGSSFTFLLPINHLSLESKDRVSLEVNLPKGYKCLQHMAQSPHFMEFIPVGETPYGWSHIYTIQTQIGKKISAKTYYTLFTEGMKQNAQDLKVLSSHEADFKKYQQAECGLAYTHGNRKEVLYIIIYSGPADLCSIQHTKVVRPYEKVDRVLEEAKKELLEKIKVIS